MKSGATSAPSYSDGDMWHFNVSEDFIAYNSRALKGLYEVRYSSKRFRVFKERQPVSTDDGQIAILFAMFRRGRYTGGQYLKFPLRIGQKWSHQYETRAMASRTVTSWTSETTVKSVENIMTPAGNVLAFKLVREAWSHRGAKATCTYYYSPQTKSIVDILWEWSHDRRIVELVKLGSGK
jgi:hypothetical protein